MAKSGKGKGSIELPNGLNAQQSAFIYHYCNASSPSQGEIVPSMREAGYVGSDDQVYATARLIFSSEEFMKAMRDERQISLAKANNRPAPNTSMVPQKRQDRSNLPPIASADEVLGFFTTVMRGDHEWALSKEGSRLRAAELLGKSLGLFIERSEVVTATVDPIAAMPSEQRRARIKELGAMLSDEADRLLPSPAQPAGPDTGEK